MRAIIDNSTKSRWGWQNWKFITSWAEAEHNKMLNVNRSTSGRLRVRISISSGYKYSLLKAQWGKNKGDATLIWPLCCDYHFWPSNLAYAYWYPSQRMWPSSSFPFNKIYYSKKKKKKTQDLNQFLAQVGIEFRISHSTIINFSSWAKKKKTQEWVRSSQGTHKISHVSLIGVFLT